MHMFVALSTLVFHLFQCIEEDSRNMSQFALNSNEKPFNTHQK